MNWHDIAVWGFGCFCGVWFAIIIGGAILYRKLNRPFKEFN